MSDKQNDRQWPADLIALKWAETLSEGEQSVLLTRSLKQLQAEINAALNAERERCAKIAEAHEGHGAWCASAAGDCQSLTVKAIAAAVRNGKKSEEWQPIGTAPKDGSHVLLWYPHWSKRPMVANWERDGSHWHSEHILSWCQDDDPGPLYWMPLPPAPADPAAAIRGSKG